jgi:hypothetical protein
VSHYRTFATAVTGDGGYEIRQQRRGTNVDAVETLDYWLYSVGLALVVAVVALAG